MHDRRPVLIAGPTASGKSALALRIAERDGGCVINADAAQVFRCWRVLTARPGATDLARARHALYGHVGCDARYSVGAWLRDLAPALDAARRLGERPIIVGGTGLYLTALTRGLAEIPEVPPAFRARGEAMLAEHGLDALRADVARRGPAALASIDPDNPRRVQRAWEVLVATGRSLAEWQREGAAPLIAAKDALCVVIQIGTSSLNIKIEHRFHTMLELGALEECRAFMASGPSPLLPAAKVLGARELRAHLEGRLSLEAATQAAVVATRRFAKRQRTWFRARMRDWTWLDPSREDALAAIPPDR